jgi:hypothetical protein
MGTSVCTYHHGIGVSKGLLFAVVDEKTLYLRQVTDAKEDEWWVKNLPTLP